MVEESVDRDECFEKDKRKIVKGTLEMMCGYRIKSDVFRRARRLSSRREGMSRKEEEGGR